MFLRCRHLTSEANNIGLQRGDHIMPRDDVQYARVRSTICSHTILGHGFLLGDQYTNSLAVRLHKIVLM